MRSPDDDNGTRNCPECGHPLDQDDVRCEWCLPLEEEDPFQEAAEALAVVALVTALCMPTHRGAAMLDQLAKGLRSNG